MTFFHEAEFECKCGCGRANMEPAFLARMETLRAAFGKPIFINSGYRCPSYNRRISPTGIDGPHTTGQAADIDVNRGDAFRLLQLAMNHGFTGIGVQQKGGRRYLHLDTLTDAPGRPRPTIWSY